MNITLLKKNIESEKRMLSLCKQMLKGMPKGSLSCYRIQNRLYFKKYDETGQKYAGTENSSIVARLKKRHLLEEMIRVLQRNIQLMEALLNGYKEFDPSTLQRNFNRAYQNIPSDFFTELGYSLTDNDQDFYEEKKIYKTSSGLMVRSRIEALIAEIYIKQGITFNYEAILQLKDGSIMRPDFTVYCPSCGKYKYHEHVGLLSDPTYKEAYFKKMEKYISNGLYPFYDVLFTYEKTDQGIDLTEIEALIELFIR